MYFCDKNRKHLFVLSCVMKNNDNAMKIECKFRTATMKDIQELKKLFCNTVMTVNRRDYTAEEVADWASCCESDGCWEQLLSTLYFIVATDVEGQMLGFTALEGMAIFIQCLCIKITSVKGIATALLQENRAYASEHGIKEMTSEVSITARPFFEHHGYKVEREQRVLANRMIMTNFMMRKTL